VKEEKVQPNANIEMEKKIIIVTGASTGLGKEIARLFIEEGHQVVMNSVHEENLLRAYQEFGTPKNALPVSGDISDSKVGDLLVKTAVDHFGSLDVLVNNAGIFEPKPFLEVGDKDLEKFINVNLKGTFFVTQAAIRQMLQQKSGSIINIGTVLVDHAIAGLPASAPLISKGAIHALTRQLAAEFGKNNIRVNTVAPGIIRTPLNGKIGVQNPDALAGLHLLNRIGEPETIARAVYYLAMDNFTSGITLNVDGGHVAGHQFA
jgi:NAD(P)-dependent dehydrogenase (short-subunit alcohol dehydrogenase family)